MPQTLISDNSFFPHSSTLAELVIYKFLTVWAAYTLFFFSN